MVDVVPDDLREDARTWEAFATDDIVTGVQTVSGLSMPFFGHTTIGELVGVSTKYANVQTRVMMLMAQAPAASARIAGALRDAAQIYEDTDNQAAIEFDRVD